MGMLQRPDLASIRLPKEASGRINAGVASHAVAGPGPRLHQG